MTWIFQECPDEYGSCIRQDVILAMSLIVLLLALYSCCKVYRRQRRLTFEILPLSINATISLIMVGIRTQMEIFNIRISLLIFQFYSYFILTYGFIYMVINQSKNAHHLKIIKILFTVFTTICLLGVISTIVLGTLRMISCDEDQGIGSIVLVALELPLLLVTYVYGRKSTTLLIYPKTNYGNSQTELNQQHLLSHDEQVKRVKLQQLKLIRFAFYFTLFLNISQVVLYYVGRSRSEIICSRDNNSIAVANLFTLILLSVEGISQLFPRIIIPIIFWYLPSRHLQEAITCYLPSSEDVHSRHETQNLKLRIKRQESKLVNDVQYEEQIRKRLNENVPKHLERTSTM